MEVWGGGHLAFEEQPQRFCFHALCHETGKVNLQGMSKLCLNDQFCVKDKQISSSSPFQITDAFIDHP